MISHLSHSANEDEKINLKDMCGKYSMDTIASCVFGVDAGSFDPSNKESRFVRDAKSVMDLDLYTGIAFGAYSIPGLSHLMNLFKIPVYKPFEMKFFINTVTQTIRSRRETKLRRNDLIDLMIDAIKDELSDEAEDEHDDADDEVKKALQSNQISKSKKLDESKVIATAVVMLVAGYDTTAITMSTCLWYLTQYPEIQKRLQEEIDEDVPATRVGRGATRRGKNEPDARRVGRESAELTRVCFLQREVTERKRCKNGCVYMLKLRASCARTGR